MKKHAKKTIFGFLTTLIITPFSTASGFGPFSSNGQANLGSNMFCAPGVGYPYTPQYAQLRSDDATCFYPEEMIGSTTLDSGLEVMGWDLIRANWSDAQNICENTTILGKNDWFLPNLDELIEMHAAKWQIGGFHNGFYWSATELDGEIPQPQYSGGNNNTNDNRAWSYLFNDANPQEVHRRQEDRYEVRCVKR
ncbi:DUF1566 domain-containing protein [Halovibrio sp. HP20-50]|uniref:Lcl domain-containing protein n=1 Tax=Halovibrio sp. HP20-59 TaxID=3080275 RepID=UPI00294B52FE|nr:DUF1566 domain-containing protein [Halovibrio sp. HP20-59]MEA2117692.1 DUF1566 domain-containing protein [Halovibrio sp. HP20-59]